jgi:hypothetical protein
MKIIIQFIVLTLLFISTVEARSNYNKYYSNRHLSKIEKRVALASTVNKKALREAFRFYKKNRYKQRLSKRYIAIADYTKKAGKKRLYIINLYNGKVYQHHVAHGKKSGARGGRVWRSSNKLNSHMTPYGFFKVGIKERVTAKRKYKYLMIRGLQKSNKKVGLPTRFGGRDVIVHTAGYVKGGGRSYGCFAIKPKDKWAVFKRLKTALLYSYTGR